MDTGETNLNGQLSAWRTLTTAACKAFPELANVSERALLLEAMALADADGHVDVVSWAAHSGIRISTMERFAKHFFSIGLINTDRIAEGRVRIEHFTMGRLQCAILSGADSKVYQ